MSDIIQLLPDHVANQIAAGEVVQRPASVVKELLENALDAGSESIQLIVKEAGKILIQVIDDGKGMSVTDARLSFERHATSKIKSAEDLFAINTKGFRGEALASIAAVSHVEMKTKQTQDEVGTYIKIEGSEIIDGRKHWILFLNARVTGLSYPKRRVWVDVEYLLPMREELYAKSGKLLKSTSMDGIKKVQGRWFPTRFIFRDELKRNSKGTEWIIDDIDFDVEIPVSRFSKARLRK